MKILHTSDWHLGRNLYGRSRYKEFEAFLDWLAEAIDVHAIDVLLVAGDIFDTSTPSNRAQKLYYRFLSRIASSCCRHVVVIAGNHDSPSFLNAPQQLLKALDVHVVGQACDNPEDELLLLADAQVAPELIICAVPYLRDRDIRLAEAGESITDKGRKLSEGIRQHYAQVTGCAEKKRQQLGRDIPIIAMGHLFAAGGKTTDDDGVRDLYIGSLAHVSASIFPPCLSYTALGHLHVPQLVNDRETIRYSGSPIAMGFGEAKQQKSVCLVSCVDGTTPATVQLIDIPVFQKLERISGDWPDIAEQIAALVSAGSEAWLEVNYQGDRSLVDLRERLDEAISGSAIEVRRIKNSRTLARIISQVDDQETLDDLNANDVFLRCLDAHNIPEEQRPELLAAYQETLVSINENDSRAE